MTSAGKAIALTVATSAAMLCGCGPGGIAISTEAKQIKACVQDVKQGLNDPESIEVVSAKPLQVIGGGHRIDLNFTAKNERGGRVRGNALCGFKTAGDTELDPEDHMNKTRDIARTLRSLGIKTR